MFTSVLVASQECVYGLPWAGAGAHRAPGLWWASSITSGTRADNIIFSWCQVDSTGKHWINNLVGGDEDCEVSADYKIPVFFLPALCPSGWAIRTADNRTFRIHNRNTKSRNKKDENSSYSICSTIHLSAGLSLISVSSYKSKGNTGFLLI